MRGQQGMQPRLWSYNVNLDRRVRADHPLRQIERLAESRFVCREVKGRCGSRGNVSVDPIVILKMMLLLFLYDVRSDRAQDARGDSTSRSATSPTRPTIMGSSAHGGAGYGASASRTSSSPPSRTSGSSSGALLPPSRNHSRASRSEFQPHWSTFVASWRHCGHSASQTRFNSAHQHPLLFPSIGQHAV